jgi:chemotaxis protein MotC
LSSIDARLLHASLAGHVAYVQGELLEKKEPAQAISYFEDAGLLAPGTIIEEAALRREIALLAAAGDVDRFETLAARYLRRFPSSVYSGGFRHNFALALAANTNVADQGRLARLTSLLGGVGPAERGEVYLTIAGEALRKGKIRLASLAASSAAALSKDGSKEGLRARLIEGATLIVADDFDKGVEALTAIERGKLGDAEQGLLDAALSVAGQIRQMPAEPEPDSAAPVDKGKSADPGEAVKRAQNALSRVDQMLSELNK